MVLFEERRERREKGSGCSHCEEASGGKGTHVADVALDRNEKNVSSDSTHPMLNENVRRT